MTRVIGAFIVFVVSFLGSESSARADTVTITVEGTVEFNQITSGPLGAVSFGDTAVMTF